ncbi:MAG TPA: hypothetical protein VKA21_03020 [Candidatus Binatia bacterium]|nr:hypothetical protein [Candidatus Binatia bacterium]
MRPAVALWFALLAGLAAPGPAAAQADDVRAFARALHVEGVPLAAVRQFDPDQALDPLLGMLADGAEESHWANVVVILGMLGDERALDPLLAVLETGDGPLSEARWRAAKSVPMALGYLVHFGGSQRALRYLVESLDPAVWPGRGIRWRSPLHADAAARDAHLTRMAVLGLALTGDPAAARVLRGADPRRVPGGKPFLDGALAEHGRVAARGLGCYYDPGRCD